MAGNSNSRPADANAAWSLLASIGTTGPAGATGPAGTLDTGAERLTDGNPYLNLYAGNNSSGGIHVLRNDANSWGYFYGDNGGVGVINGAGQWAIQSNGPVNATNTAVTLFSEGAARAVFNSQGLTLPGANPTLLSGASYIIIPNGAYFNGGGTAYFSNQSMHRGGVNNDQGTLTLTGSNNVVNSASTCG